MKSGLYIAKCYWKNTGTNRVFPVLKYGYTKNIDTRMSYYNDHKKHIIAYQLVCFFPCNNKLKQREEFIRDENYNRDIFDEWRARGYRSEHIPYSSSMFRSLYYAVKQASELKFFKDRIEWDDEIMYQFGPTYKSW